MKHTIKCLICNETKTVNGQRGIETFGAAHKHNLEDWKFKTGLHLELDTVDTKTPSDFYTGGHTQSVRDYWRYNILKH